jgi:hypothetical protein
MELHGDCGIELNVPFPLRKLPSDTSYLLTARYCSRSLKIAANPISIIEDPKDGKKSVGSSRIREKVARYILKDATRRSVSHSGHTARSFFSCPLSASARRVMRNVCVLFLQFNDEKLPTAEMRKNDMIGQKEVEHPEETESDRKRQCNLS